MKEPLNIVKMKIFKVVVEDSEYWVGEDEKEFLVFVFGTKAVVEEIELSSNSGSDTLIGDENSFKCTHGQSSQEGSL